MGMKIRQSLETAIYVKAMKISLTRSVDYNKGKLINLLMVDCTKVYTMFTYLA